MPVDGSLGTRFPQRLMPVLETLRVRSCYPPLLFEPCRMWTPTLRSSPRQEAPPLALWVMRSKSSLDKKEDFFFFDQVHMTRTGQIYTAGGWSSRLMTGLTSHAFLSCWDGTPSKGSGGMMLHPNATHSSGMVPYPKELLEPRSFLPYACIINLTHFMQAFNPL